MHKRVALAGIGAVVALSFITGVVFLARAGEITIKHNGYPINISMPHKASL